GGDGIAARPAADRDPGVGSIEPDGVVAVAAVDGHRRAAGSGDQVVDGSSRDPAVNDDQIVAEPALDEPMRSRAGLHDIVAGAGVDDEIVVGTELARVIAGAAMDGEGIVVAKRNIVVAAAGVDGREIPGPRGDNGVVAVTAVDAAGRMIPERDRVV